MKSLVAQRLIHWAAEGHQLGLDAYQMGNCAHAVKHFVQQTASDGFLRIFGRDIQPADQAFLLFHYVKTVARGGAIFKCHAARQGVGVEEAFDQLEGSAIIPM